MEMKHGKPYEAFAVGKYEAHPEKRVHEARPVGRKVMLRLFGLETSEPMDGALNKKKSRFSPAPMGGSGSLFGNLNSVDPSGCEGITEAGENVFRFIQSHLQTMERMLCRFAGCGDTAEIDSWLSGVFGKFARFASRGKFPPFFQFLFHCEQDPFLLPDGFQQVFR